MNKNVKIIIASTLLLGGAYFLYKNKKKDDCILKKIGDLYNCDDYDNYCSQKYLDKRTNTIYIKDSINGKEFDDKWIDSQEYSYIDKTLANELESFYKSGKIC
jgi:hypothetical protein